MTLYKFNKLSFDHRLLVLDLRGVSLDFRIDDNYYIVLFQVDSFYVEAFYLKGRIQAEKLHVFASTSKLKHYLEQIDIQQLLS